MDLVRKGDMNYEEDELGSCNGALPVGKGWIVRATREAHHCINPIRSIVEVSFAEALKLNNPDKELIKLSLGKCYFVNLSLTQLIRTPLIRTPLFSLR